jgi:hypothetical protein
LRVKLNLHSNYARQGSPITLNVDTYNKIASEGIKTLDFI